MFGNIISMNDGGITVAIGAIVSIVGGFGVIAKVMLNQSAKDRTTALEQAAKDREADRAERKELTKAIKDMAGATGHQADATVQSAKEAEQRNGHLGKQNVHIARLAAESNQMTKEILTSLVKTAGINAEDRDVLTNQDHSIEEKA